MKKIYLALGLLVLIVPTLVLASVFVFTEKPVADDKYVDALNDLAYQYNQAGRYSEAAAVLKELIALEPKNPSRHYDYAVNVVLTIKQDNDGTIEEVQDALDHFKIANELSPGIQNARENIAFLEDMKAQYDSKQ